ncbi:hypothetical protein Poli38472_002650 [Pythium oligandrum]|uniref:PX domain-containing protein n=1 Tax=Pythium oligandrum TaxID=41045 RepID=A0A8K1CIJ5_PYTOL|nr:hypothetical protein Poli38472_002650 [Pythium oligandrum]|eukprot:TMW63709.1 hypothetical protein Poli38472_002650 [Pythium oligandrum]
MLTESSIPLLNRIATEPIRQRKSHAELAFLRRVEKIEIEETMEIEGVTFYVMNIYMSQSRIPTVIQKKHAMGENVPYTRPTPRKSEAPRDPDFRMLHRFSDFELLRAQLWAMADSETRRSCGFCKTWNSFFSSNSAQPKFRTKLMPSTDFRREMLAQFMTMVIYLISDMPANQPATHRRCEIGDDMVDVVYQFLRPKARAQQPEPHRLSGFTRR